MILTQSFLKSILAYNPDTGEFTKNKKIAGYIDKQSGYVKVMIKQKNYFAHRLAFLYMTGSFPTKHVDHINKDKSNNSWKNLREVSQEVNNQHYIEPTKRNKLKVLGVRQRGNSYTSSVSFNKKQYHAGTYSTPEQAHEAYVNLKRQLHIGNML